MEKLISTKDGSLVYYQLVGQGPALFLLHGNGGSSKDFKRQIAYLKKDFQLILMDTRDHGRSNNQSTVLDFETIIYDMNLILTHERIETTSLLGFSDGANIALKFAVTFPEKCQRLIGISPNLTFDHLKKKHQIVSTKLFWLADNLLHSTKLKRVLSLAQEDLNLTPAELRKLEAPTLIIMGDRDIVSPENMKELVAPLPKGELFILKNSGHSILRFGSKEIKPLILNFLQEKK